MAGERRGLEADAREDPTACGRLPARCRTIAGYSGPIAESSLEALGEERHRAQEDRQAVVPGRTAAAESSLGEDNLDPEEDNPDLGVGTVAVAEEGQSLHCSSHWPLNALHGQRHRVRHWEHFHGNLNKCQLRGTKPKLTLRT